MNVDLEELKEKLAYIDKEKVTIVFFGQPGSGKSSTINAICGAPVAEVGVSTDTTTGVKVIEHGDLLFVDLPGYGTDKFPKEEFFAKFSPLQYDLFICVFADKLHTADTDFFKILQNLHKPCIFVRNKTDEIYEEDKTLEQSEEDIRQDVIRQVGTTDFTLLFISARDDMKQGIDELNDAIMAKMDAARREKYILEAEARTEEQLNKKKEAALHYVKKSSTYAAFNGLNPMLGIDATIDIIILFQLYSNIRAAFAITEETLKRSTSGVSKKALIVKGMSKEGIKLIFKSLGKRFAAKTVLKYVPVLGQASAAYLGHSMVEKAGREYVDACYAVAREKLLQELNAKRS
jgi:GTP-binding protein EngB required for normal cell division